MIEKLGLIEGEVLKISIGGKQSEFTTIKPYAVADMRDKLNEVIRAVNILSSRPIKYTKTDASWSTDGSTAIGIKVKKTDSKGRKLYLTKEGMQAHDGTRWIKPDLRIESPRTDYEKGWNDALKALGK